MDFNLPTATVFTGSSNLSPSGEAGNGDHLICIQDQRIATAYAIEALRMFDHLHFRTRMSDAKAAAGASPVKAVASLTLRKPRVLTGEAAWFEAAYVRGRRRRGIGGCFRGEGITAADRGGWCTDGGSTTLRKSRCQGPRQGLRTTCGDLGGDIH